MYDELEFWYHKTVQLKDWFRLYIEAERSSWTRNTITFKGVPVNKFDIRKLAGQTLHVLGPNTTEDRRLPLLTVQLRTGKIYYIMPEWVERIRLEVVKCEVTPEERIASWIKRRNKHLNKEKPC